MATVSLSPPQCVICGKLTMLCTKDRFQLIWSCKNCRTDYDHATRYEILAEGTNKNDFEERTHLDDRYFSKLALQRE